jgi:glutamate synthase (NADPH/NADH) large chain
LKIRYIDEQPNVIGFRTAAVDGLFLAEGETSAAERLARAIDGVSNEVVALVRSGVNVIILSDRGTSATHAAIPSLLLASAVHHRLVDEHLRTSAALILEAGDVREIHHVALLLGFGASAVCPYLAYESIDALIHEGELTALSAFEARYQYGKSLNKGVVKVMSKMGVSTVATSVRSSLSRSASPTTSSAAIFQALPAASAV